jgi:Tol biopolymer transport system component/predicted Ser/Thr protein kinase
MVGQTVSHYKILEKLGEGGMGVVYKAQDLTLDRFVALKFLPPHVAASPEDKARFIQEARAVAALTHPNICTVYSVEEQDGKAFIAMEYVDGKTLKHARQAYPLKQAVEIGAQIADGLAAAHEKGIVHRDIKPENIMLRKDGRVQIMDFGLAKLKGASRLTKEGSTTGTVGYMSPEQIQGQDTDHRSDIFSLGVVLYELCAGRSPFKAAHETAIAYEIVHVDPEPISATLPDFDPGLESIILDCLEKDPNERCQSAAEVSRDLRRIKRESSRTRTSRVTASRPLPAPAMTQPEVKPQRAFRDRIWMGAAGVLLLACLGLGALALFRPAAGVHTVRAFLPPVNGERFYFYGNYGGAASISPDGTHLAYVASDSLGRKLISVRDLRSGTVRRLDGTMGAIFPFWSPDSRFIGFASYEKLRTIDANGGNPVTVCDAPNYRGGSWSPNGTIIFCPISGQSGLVSVPAQGGTPTQLTELDAARKENSHRWPFFLPDGKHFLYFARTVTTGTQSGGDAVCVGSLDGKDTKILLRTSSNAVYQGGFIIYARGGSLVAQPFDERSLELQGDPATLAQELSFDPSTSRGMFSVSQDGILVYQTGVVQLGDHLAVMDRSGKRLRSVGDLVEYQNVRLSPDGQRVASFIYDYQSHNNNIWITDLARGSRTRLTFGSSWEMYPVWSPDGGQIIYHSNPEGRFDLYVKNANGAGTEELVLHTEEDKQALDWSSDGKYVLFEDRGGIWYLPMAQPASGSRVPKQFIALESSAKDARFSPDTRWVAYMSDESGQREIYVRAFPGSGGKRQISTAGGSLPVWRKDGKELYYLTAESIIMAAEVTLKESTVEVNNVRPLFQSPSYAFDASPDGRQFVAAAPHEIQNQSPLTLVVNWNADLKKK